MTGDNAMRTVDDHLIAGLERSAHQYAIALGMQNFDIPLFDAESAVVRLEGGKAG